MEWIIEAESLSDFVDHGRYTIHTKSLVRCRECKHHHRDNSGAYYCGRKEYGYGWGLNDWYPSEVEPNVINCQKLTFKEIRESIARECDLVGDCQRLRANPECFESLRNNYTYRQETL